VIAFIATAAIVIGGAAGPAAYGDHKPSHKKTVVYCFEISIIPDPLCHPTIEQCESVRELAIARGAPVSSECYEDKIKIR
jgi:hypothetical protein